MSLNRTKLWLVAWVLALLTGVPASGQGVRDMALFAPSDLSTYGGGIRPREGLFFNFDWLYWGINAPKVATIGDPTIDPQTVYTGPSIDQSYQESNSVDTSFLQTWFREGERIEFGAILEHHGWLFSGFRLNTIEQTLIVRDAHVLFRDTLNQNGVGFLQGNVDEFGAFRPNGQVPRLPTLFNYLKAKSNVTPWGVELSYIYRTHPTHHGGIFEIYLGARYLQFKDSFHVYGLDAPPSPPRLATSGGTSVSSVTTVGEGVPTTGGDDNFGGGGGDIIGRPNGVPAAPLPYEDQPIILADSYWNTYADNHLIGPQIGLRHFQTWGRWTLSTEGRFAATYNSQDFRQDGMIGSKLHPPGGVGYPLYAEPHSFTHSAHLNDWSPITELRLEAMLSITKTISIGAGWNGMYLGNIARAANVINYEVPNMGLNANVNTARQSVFMNGLNLKLIINR